jgi:DNA-binding PadR family transcriptional regulator
MSDETLENLRLELRRGSLILGVLSGLRTEKYGYTLRKELGEDGLRIDEDALYPMLRRLESQGLLTSTWREEDSRKKRFYLLSKEGAELLAQLEEEWRALNASLDRILARGKDLGSSQPVSRRRRGPAA